MECEHDKTFVKSYGTKF